LAFHSDTKPSLRKKPESEEGSEAEVNSEIESCSDREPTPGPEPEPVGSGSNTQSQSQSQSQKKRRRQCKAEPTTGSSQVDHSQASKASRLMRSAKGKAVAKHDPEIDDVQIDPLLL